MVSGAVFGLQPIAGAMSRAIVSSIAALVDAELAGHHQENRIGRLHGGKAMVRNAMKKGLPGDRLQLVDWELSRGGPTVLPLLSAELESPA